MVALELFVDFASLDFEAVEPDFFAVCAAFAIVNSDQRPDRNRRLDPDAERMSTDGYYSVRCLHVVSHGPELSTKRTDVAPAWFLKDIKPEFALRHTPVRRQGPRLGC